MTQFAPSEDGLSFRVGEDAIGDDVNLVGVWQDKANAEAAPIDEIRPLTVVCRQDDGELVGAAIGRTWGKCSELQQLWVTARSRRTGIGRRLIQCFEAGVSERGCELEYLDTFSFQGPGFYERLGYEMAFELEGFPEDIRKYLMVRQLVDLSDS